MSSIIILPFPTKFHPVRVAPAHGGGWLVLCRNHGWLHGSRDEALVDAEWIAAGYGVRVVEHAT